jgi:hypothetical protein
MGRRLAFAAAIASCGRIDFAPLDGSPDSGPGPNSFGGLCRFDQITLIQDGNSIDDNVAAMIFAGLRAGCQTNPAMRTVTQNDPGVLDPTTNRPLLQPGELGIMGGGDSSQRGLAYLLQNDTPLVWAPIEDTFTQRATGAIVSTRTGADSKHDYGAVMVVYEPISGAYLVSGQGAIGVGTTVSGVWFQDQLAPMLRSDVNQWYVVFWSDSDATPGPSAGDTFTIVASAAY